MPRLGLLDGVDGKESNRVNAGGLDVRQGASLPVPRRCGRCGPSRRAPPHFQIGPQKTGREEGACELLAPLVDGGLSCRPPGTVSAPRSVRPGLLDQDPEGQIQLVSPFPDTAEDGPTPRWDWASANSSWATRGRRPFAASLNPPNRRIGSVPPTRVIGPVPSPRPVRQPVVQCAGAGPQPGGGPRVPRF